MVGLCGLGLLVSVGEGDPALGLVAGVELVGPLGLGTVLGVGLLGVVGLTTGRTLGDGAGEPGLRRGALGVAVGDFCDGCGLATWSGLGAAEGTTVPGGSPTGAVGRVGEAVAVGVGWVAAS